MKRTLLLATLLLALAPSAMAAEKPWLILGYGKAELLPTREDNETHLQKFGIGIPSYDGTPLALEIAYLDFNRSNGLRDDKVITMDFMPYLDLGPVRLFGRAGGAMMASSAKRSDTGAIYGGGAEVVLWKGDYRWKLRVDFERFTDVGSLTFGEDYVDAITAGIVIAH